MYCKDLKFELNLTSTFKPFVLILVKYGLRRSINIKLYFFNYIFFTYMVL